MLCFGHILFIFFCARSYYFILILVQTEGFVFGKKINKISFEIALSLKLSDTSRYFFEIYWNFFLSEQNKKNFSKTSKKKLPEKRANALNLKISDTSRQFFYLESFVGHKSDPVRLKRVTPDRCNSAGWIFYTCGFHHKPTNNLFKYFILKKISRKCEI